MGAPFRDHAGQAAGPPRARRRIWTFGAAVIAAIAVFAFVGLYPLRSMLGENRRVRSDQLVLAHLTNLRTALADWQVYLEPRLLKFSSTPSTIDPADLAKGSQLDQLITSNGNDTVTALEALGVVTNVREVKAANTAILAAIAALAPLAEGRPAAVITSAIATERTAYARARNASGVATTQVARRERA